MNKYKIIIAVTVILLLINTTILGFLWFGKKEKVSDNIPAGGPGMVESLLKEKLSLTDDQVKQFRVLREAHFTMNRKLLDSLRIQKDQLFSLLGKSEVTSSAVDSITSIISGIEKKKDLNTFDHFSKLRLMLSPDQQQKFDLVINDVLRMVAGPQRGGPPPMRREGPPPGEGPPPPGERPAPGEEQPPK